MRARALALGLGLVSWAVRARALALGLGLVSRAERTRALALGLGLVSWAVRARALAWSRVGFLGCEGKGFGLVQGWFLGLRGQGL